MVVLKQPVRDTAQVVAHLVWDQEVGGSSPVIPTMMSFFNLKEKIMETIIAFGWGAVTMFFIGMSVVVFQLKNQVKQLSLTNQNLERYISDVSREMEETNSQLHQRMDGDVNDLQRQLDSRLDRLEHKLTSDLNLLKEV